MRSLTFAATAVVALSSAPVIAEGDAGAGEDVFRRCSTFHTIDEGGRAKQDPNLYGVYGREAGTASDFDRYSQALVGSDITWTEENLTQWRMGPSTFISSAKMTFRLSDEKDIADVIAYLKVNSSFAEQTALIADEKAVCVILLEQDADRLGFVGSGQGTCLQPVYRVAVIPLHGGDPVRQTAQKFVVTVHHLSPLALRELIVNIGCDLDVDWSGL